MDNIIYQGYARFPTSVQNGAIVMPEGVDLPDGTELIIVVKPIEFTAEERAEFEEWDKLSEKAWRWIDDFEREEEAKRDAG